ncbi:MAG: hypothetical protein ACI89X_003609 [Planctomycetota bacterium]|jgi:hypothetical protein
MRGKAILVLLLLVSGLVGVLVFTDETPPVTKVDSMPVLQGRSLTTATKIRWQFHEMVPIEIGHAPDGRFQIQEPLRDIASMAYLRQMVFIWDSANMQATKHPDTEEGRAKTGLITPELRFIVEWEDGKRIEVELGAEGPLGDSRFIRLVDVENSRIWEGGPGLIPSMRVGLNDLRSRQVFRHASGSITSVRLDQANSLGRREPVHMKTGENDEWVLVEPVTGRADPAAAQKFVTAITSLRVTHFQPGNINLPERDPDIRIELKGAYGEEKVDLWMESGQIWGLLPARGHIFTSSNNQYGQVFVNAVNNLRARILVPMNESTFEELCELIIDPGQGRGDRIRLLRKSQTSPWRLIEPVTCQTSPTPVNEAANALHQLVARAFVVEDGVRPRSNDPRFGMDGARWSVTTRRLRKKEMYTLWFGSDVPVAIGSDEEALVYACRSDEPDNVAVVQKLPLETLQRSWLVYCDKQIRQHTAIVERMELQRRAGKDHAGVVQEAEQRSFAMQKDESWRLEGAEADRTEVGDFARETLRDFVGTKAVDIRAGFDEPDWVLSLKRANGDELGLIGFWDGGENKPLIAKARGGADEVGFELSKRQSTALRAFWK